MTNREMSEEEKRKEIAENLDLNMFVEAGAGAGKTTLIVQRIVNMLSAGVEPGEIVVITFTNAAAEELRGRITCKVDQAAKNDPKMKKKLLRLNDMNISTIHSFCNVLLHEQGLMTGLPIDIEMLQDEEERKEKKGYFDAYLKTLTGNDWDKLEADMGKKESRRTIRENMEKLFWQMADLPEDTDIRIPKVPDSSQTEQAWNSLEIVITGDEERKIPSLEERLTEAINSCIKEGKADPAGSLFEVKDFFCGKGKEPVSGKFSCLLKTDGERTQEEKDVLYLALLSAEKAIPKLNYKAMIDKEKIDGANQKLSAEISKILTEEIRKVIPMRKPDELKDDDGNKISLSEALNASIKRNRHGVTVAVYARNAREYYRCHAKKNQITNDRLLELTRDLILNENTGVLEYFSKKYKHFFVDEFQDTDRIQESFIYRLASEVEDGTKLRKGALFLVGDPKQSIYRFRGAQPVVYFQAKEKMKKSENAKVYELAYNFRSNEKVIEWVNEKFCASDEITPIVDEGGICYEYQPMTPKKKVAEGDHVISGIYHIGKPDAEHCIGQVTRHLKTGDKKTEGYVYNEGFQEKDIENVVDLILNLTKKDENGDGYFKITDYDDEHRPFARDIRLSDFLLVSHNKQRMDDYLSAMKRYGIPVVLDGEENLKTDRGLAVFVRLYQYLANPRDSFYRTGAEEALRETLHMEKEKELHELSMKILDCLYDDAKRMSAYGMAEYLERQVSLLFDKGQGIRSVWARSSQAHIRQMVENLCMNVTGTGIEMAEAMQKYIDAGLEHELSLEDGPDAVHFMNLHKTKGLEGNIVVILDRMGKYDKTSSCCTEGSSFYPGVDRFWTSLKDYPVVMENAKKADAAEFHRLEYVAVTRAAQAVIFMDVLQKNGIFAKKKLAGTSIKKEELDPEFQNGPAIYSKLDDKTFSYQIAEAENILETIKNTIPEEIRDNQPYKAENPQDYEIKKDDYTGREKEEPAKDGMVETVSPSGLEKSVSAKKRSGKKSEEYNWELLRPIGNAMGDILHRGMELVVGRKFVKSGISIEDSVSQAVGENRDHMDQIRSKLIEDLEKEGLKEKTEKITEEKTEEMVKEFILACAWAYDSYLDGFWENVADVYPEVHFSYQKTDAEDETVTEWMNGTADLILEMKDGTYRLIDYKSDNDFLVSEEEMDRVLEKKYSPQLAVYRSVIRTMLGAGENQIETGIISFSQKDESGKMLSGKSVRVRYTGLDGILYS